MPRSSPSAPSPTKRQAATPKLLLVLSLLAGANGLAACASNIGDSMPASIGGLPEGAPERPAQPPAYPAVHEIPPPRAARMLDDEQQEKLEKDLSAARDRQEGRNPKASPKVKKPATGAQPNP